MKNYNPDDDFETYQGWPIKWKQKIKNCSLCNAEISDDFDYCSDKCKLIDTAIEIADNEIKGETE